jgi:hypothetical protein
MHLASTADANALEVCEWGRAQPVRWFSELEVREMEIAHALAGATVALAVDHETVRLVSAATEQNLAGRVGAPRRPAAPLSPALGGHRRHRAYA